jgi:hypothetical protein
MAVPGAPWPGTLAAPTGPGARVLRYSALCMPITSSASCHQVIFVDQTIDLSLSSDAVLAEVDRLG